MEHCRIIDAMVLDGFQLKSVEVREKEQLADESLSALIIPGGESTAIAKVAAAWGVLDGLKEWVRKGKPVLGTCAGLILLADEVEHQKRDGQELIGGLEVTACRNFYGRQKSSFKGALELSDEISFFKGKLFDGIFIRAPGISRCSEKVSVLATFDHNVVAVVQNRLMALAFHPELSGSSLWHEYFILKAVLGRLD